MWLIIPFFLFLIQPNQVEPCGLKKIECLNSTSFYHCRKVGNKIIQIGELKSCATGYGCHESIGFFPCEKQENLPVVTTTTPRPEPICDNETNYNKKMPFYNEKNILDCRKYVTCKRVIIGWFKIEESCPSGTGYSITQENCVREIDPNTCNKIEIASTTTPRPDPKCTSKATEFFPYYDGNVPNCAKYYECVDSFFWSWNIQLRTCPDGTGFSAETLKCETDISPETCMPKRTTDFSAPEIPTPTTTTTKPTTTITILTTLRPEPNCDILNAKFPFYNGNVKNCAKYLECEEGWFWSRNINEKTCPSGTGFSETTLSCEPEISPETCERYQVTSEKGNEGDLLTEPPVTTIKPSTGINQVTNFQNIETYSAENTSLDKTVEKTTLTTDTETDINNEETIQNIENNTTETPIIDINNETTIQHIENDTTNIRKTAHSLTTELQIEPQEESTTISVSTTIRPTPTCNWWSLFPFYEGNVKNCGKYILCNNFFGFIKLIEKTCPDGTGFSEDTRQCETSISPDTCQVIPERL